MKLPWPDVQLPTYSSGRHGRWSLSLKKGAMPGYFTLDAKQTVVPVLSRVDRGRSSVWMSLAPMELESHMPHIEAAHGNVVVMGLGMGMYLYNIINKLEVSSVTVVERDPHVYLLLREISGYDYWPGIEKVKIIIGDARTWLPEKPVDFLYVDIWPLVGDTRAAGDIQSIAANVNPGMIGYWTQEFDYVSWLANRKIAYEDSTRSLYREFMQGNGCHMVGIDQPDYHWMAIIAVLVQAAASQARSGKDPLFLHLLKKRIIELHEKLTTI